MGGILQLASTQMKENLRQYGKRTTRGCDCIQLERYRGYQRGDSENRSPRYREWSQSGELMMDNGLRNSRGSWSHAEAGPEGCQPLGGKAALFLRWDIMISMGARPRGPGHLPVRSRALHTTCSACCALCIMFPFIKNEIRFTYNLYFNYQNTQ